jgi:hypothetical protein
VEYSFCSEGWDFEDGAAASHALGTGAVVGVFWLVRVGYTFGWVALGRRKRLRGIVSGANGDELFKREL